MRFLTTDKTPHSDGIFEATCRMNGAHTSKTALKRVGKKSRITEKGNRKSDSRERDIKRLATARTSQVRGTYHMHGRCSSAGSLFCILWTTKEDFLVKGKWSRIPTGLLLHLPPPFPPSQFHPRSSQKALVAILRQSRALQDLGSPSFSLGLQNFPFFPSLFPGSSTWLPIRIYAKGYNLRNARFS